jgi:hypothetical protein
MRHEGYFLHLATLGSTLSPQLPGVHLWRSQGRTGQGSPAREGDEWQSLAEAWKWHASALTNAQMWPAAGREPPVGVTPSLIWPVWNSCPRWTHPHTLTCSPAQWVCTWEPNAILVSCDVHCCLKIRQINMAWDKDSIWQILPWEEIKQCDVKQLSKKREGVLPILIEVNKQGERFASNCMPGNRWGMCSRLPFSSSWVLYKEF